MIPDWGGYTQFRAAFAEVIDERYYTLDWLDQQVLQGKVQFWRSDNAACITEIKHYPTGAKDLHALIAAGDIGEMINKMLPRAEQWAREQGCVSALVESREGWSRALKPYGYQTFQTTVRKEL